ncbi:hypothetical protein NQ314_009801 [Rhamnusium bicolor]|uniref:Uncharacterized protein n=1 Tax=Rhamnusium bicolor TaxID=1586634 RepID=A0AAV8XXM7_9CUCU|nr:hypothetical protein NQ314_009801 [Rhamnusium bicolor]
MRKSRKIDHSSKRMRKIQGSNKINYACTSQIRVIVNKNKCTAFYYKTHYGHNIDLQHLHIPKDERSIIAAKLSSGVSVSQ